MCDPLEILGPEDVSRPFQMMVTDAFLLDAVRAAMFRHQFGAGNLCRLGGASDGCPDHAVSPSILRLLGRLVGPADGGHEHLWQKTVNQVCSHAGGEYCF